MTSKKDMKLIPFTPEYYPDLLSWIATPELNYQWGGPAYHFPLTLDQIERHCGQAEIFPFLFQLAGQNAGFIEFRRVNASTCRVCRVLILDSHKGQGLAKEMLSLLIAKAKEMTGCSRFSLSVFEHNNVAISLYRSLGFEVVFIEELPELLFGRHWTAWEMEARF